MARVEVITGVERRRYWSEEQKREIVAAAFAPGASVAEVARREDITREAIYRWRSLFRQAEAGFSKVVVASEPPTAPGKESPVIDIVLADGGRARILASTPPELAAAVIKALTRR